MIRTTMAIAAVFGLLGAATAAAQETPAEEETTPAPDAPDEEPSAPQDDAAADRAPTTEWEHEQAAQRSFLEGRAAFDAGEYARAVELFEQAYEHSPRPELQFNIGQAYDRLRDDERALEAFELFLRTSPPSSPQRPGVESRVRVLRDQIEQRRALEAPPPPPPEPTIFEQWWFWAIVGGVVVAGAVTAILIASAEADVQPPLPGDDGLVVQTLRLASW